MTNQQDEYIRQLVSATAVDGTRLRTLMILSSRGENINEFNRFDELKQTVIGDPTHLQMAKQFFEKKEKHIIPLPRIKQRIDRLLRDFIAQ